MSDTPRTITLRPIATGEFYRVGDYLRDGAGILWPITRREGGRLYTSEGSVSGTDDLYREANPIPEGYEVCDLADATKVLIGETWCDVDFSVDLSPEERAKIVAERADVKYGPFASLHEAYGVLIEEISEFTEELLNEIGRDKVKPDYLPQLVGFMRCNDLTGFVGHVIAVRHQMRNCCEFMLNDRIQAEAIDVIAVCDRIIAQWGEPS